MDLIAEGKYRGRPVAAALGLSSKGTEQIAVQFEFIDPVGTRLTWYGFFTDLTTERTIESLRHCGWQGDDLSVFVEGSPLPEGFDREVELVVKHEEYQEKVQARIAFVNSGGGLALKNALDKDQAAAFAKRMKAKITAFDRAAGRTARPAASGRPAPAARAAPTAQPAQAKSAFEEMPAEVLEAQAASALPEEDSPFNE